MSLEYQKQGKIIAIIDTVVTVIYGIVALIVFGYYITIKANPKALEVGTEDQNQNLVTGFLILTVVFWLVFLINLGMLVLLWKAILNNSPGKCSGWYITQIVFTVLNVLSLFKSGAYHPGYVYVIQIIYIGYRMWSILIIKSLRRSILQENQGEQQQQQQQDKNNLVSLA